MGLQSYADTNSMPIRFDRVGLFPCHHAVLSGRHEWQGREGTQSFSHWPCIKAQAREAVTALVQNQSWNVPTCNKVSHPRCLCEILSSLDSIVPTVCFLVQRAVLLLDKPWMPPIHAPGPFVCLYLLQYKVFLFVRFVFVRFLCIYMLLSIPFPLPPVSLEASLTLPKKITAEQLPCVMWTWLPGSSGVYVQLTRPRRTGQSQRSYLWCWNGQSSQWGLQSKRHKVMCQSKSANSNHSWKVTKLSWSKHKSAVFQWEALRAT